MTYTLSMRVDREFVEDSRLEEFPFGDHAFPAPREKEFVAADRDQLRASLLGA